MRQAVSLNSAACLLRMSRAGSDSDSDRQRTADSVAGQTDRRTDGQTDSVAEWGVERGRQGGAWSVERSSGDGRGGRGWGEVARVCMA
jgi:hypothetical protein